MKIRLHLGSIALAVIILHPCVVMAATAMPTRWSLSRSASKPVAPPASGASTGKDSDQHWSFGDRQAQPEAVSTPSSSSGFRIAPTISNLLNSRHDLSQAQTGADGAGNGYLKSVGRTLGVALRKSLF